jgi:hypothetical protein
MKLNTIFGVYFIYGLINDAVSTSDCTTSIDGVIIKPLFVTCM